MLSPWYNIFVPIYKSVNKNFFKIRNSSMFYVLGFFAADGSMSLNKRGANFWSIQITDKSLLYNIRKIIGSEHKIGKRVGRHENDRTIYRLQIGSKEMCNDLRILGFTENKTNNMSIPNIPTKFFPDFIRGYFDGDGNVWTGFIHRNRKTKTRSILVAFTSASKIFLEDLASRLKNLGIRGSLIRYKDGNYFRLQYSTNSALKLYYFMYNSEVRDFNGLYLRRKYRIFEKFIDLRP